MVVPMEILIGKLAFRIRSSLQNVAPNSQIKDMLNNAQSVLRASIFSDRYKGSFKQAPLLACNVNFCWFSWVLCSPLFYSSTAGKRTLSTVRGTLHQDLYFISPKCCVCRWESVFCRESTSQDSQRKILSSMIQLGLSNVSASLCVQFQ